MPEFDTGGRKGNQLATGDHRDKTKRYQTPRLADLIEPTIGLMDRKALECCWNRTICVETGIVLLHKIT